MMMAREPSSRNILLRTEDLAQSIAKDYSTIHLINRGTCTFADENLRGTVRFGRRRGNFLPTLEPYNSSRLAEGVVLPANSFKLTNIPSIFSIPDIIVELGAAKEFVQVLDIDEETGVVTATRDLFSEPTEGDEVLVYAVPIESIGPWSLGDSTIQVRSEYRIVIGDQIAIDTTEDLINSLVATTIEDVTFLGTTVDGLYNYELGLAEGITRSLVDEGRLFLRAQVAYESAAIRTSRVTGPFVLDYISGPFFDESVIEDFLNVQLLDSIGDPLPGYENAIPVGKNHAVAAVPIRGDSLLFWDKIQGSIQLRDGRFVAVTDEDGFFAITTHLVPPFPAGNEWEIPAVANGSCLVRVKFDPNDYRNFNLTPGLGQRILVGAGSSEQDTTRIEIAIRSAQPNVEIELGDWIPITQAHQIVYQITSTAYGDNVWQASSLILKPYFFTTDDIRARYDFSAYDNGTIHL